jgi:hypothetical protein
MEVHVHWSVSTTVLGARMVQTGLYALSRISIIASCGVPGRERRPL